MTDELKTFVHDAVTRSGAGRFGAMRGLDEPLLEPDAGDEDDVAEAAGQLDQAEAETDPATEVVGLEAVQAWTATLSAEQHQAVVADADLAAREYHEWLAAQGMSEAVREKLFAWWLGSGDEPDDPADELEDARRDPNPSRALAAAILDGRVAVQGDPAEFLLAALTATPEEWTAATGWDADLKPGQGSLPPVLESERMRRWFAGRKADIAAGRARYLGE